MTDGLDALLAALQTAPEGLTRPELLARLREQIPYLQPSSLSIASALGSRDVEHRTERAWL